MLIRHFISSVVILVSSYVRLYLYVKAAKTRPYQGCVAEEDVIDAAYRIVADHTRMFTIAISDGLMPGRRESE